SAPRRSLRRYLRRDDLPGAGNGGGEPAGRLLVRPGRLAQARDGKKGQGKDGEGAREFYRRLRARKQDPREKGERDLRFAGEICRLRIQQEPQCGVWID